MLIVVHSLNEFSLNKRYQKLFSHTVLEAFVCTCPVLDSLLQWKVTLVLKKIYINLFSSMHDIPKVILNRFFLLITTGKKKRRGQTNLQDIQYTLKFNDWVMCDH